MIRTVLLCSAIVLIAIAVVSKKSRAQDGSHGVGHAEHHDAYKMLANPATGLSCCNAQTEANPNGDCRPGTVWRDADGNLRARIGGREMSVPEAALVPNLKNPHPPVGMICERDGHFYCVAMSGAGG